MKNKRNFPLLTVLSLLLSILVIAAIPTEAEGKIYEDTVRLHILANSDTEIDQALKLEIRDRLIDKYSFLLSSYDKKDDAIYFIEQILPDIEADVNFWISELGFAYEAKASLVTEWYDTRYYEDITMPKGYYTSLKIMIGEAMGQNWWCVMYPPLCLEVATDNNLSYGYSRREMALIKNENYKVKFKILELISEMTR